jgi:regulator of protease activity HflC (stomatin/prohibitin superfamily)
VDVIWFVAIAVLLGGLVLRFAVRSVIVPPANVTLQYRGGRFVQELQPGRYWLLDFDRSLRLHAVPTMRLPMVAPDCPSCPRISSPSVSLLPASGR